MKNIQIGIENKSFFVHIGCTEEEKNTKQEVLITIIIQLKEKQKGCTTDKLEDVYCNGKMIEAVELLCGNNRYNLIEFFATKIKTAIQMQFNIADENTISVKVYKKLYQSFCIV
jgi:dihydroneopterin aldolase